MLRYKDLSGQRFGRLIALYPMCLWNSHSKVRKIKWVCKCDCGNEHITYYGCLKRFESKSCGCLKIDYAINNAITSRLDKGVSGRNYLMGNYKRRALKKKISFDLTSADFCELTSSNCYYCGIVPSQQIRPSYAKEGSHGEYTYNGIDRVDSFKGYTKDNCVACCKTCNVAKLNMSQSEFIEWIARITKYQRNTAF